MGYIRTSLARAQRTRFVSPPASLHVHQGGIREHELTEAWTTPSGIAIPGASVLRPRQPAPLVARAEPTISEVAGRVQSPERQENKPAFPPASLPLASVTQSAVPGAAVPTRAQALLPAAIGAQVDSTRNDSRAQRKTVTLGLRDQPRAPLPEMNRRSTPEAQKAVESASREYHAESQTEAAPTQNSSPPPVVRTEAAKIPKFRVNWLEGNRSIPPVARERVERELVLAARSEFRQRAEAAKAEQPSVEIRVEHLTVKIENTAAAPPPPPTTLRTAAAGTSPDFSDYFLRRSISGF